MRGQPSRAAAPVISELPDDVVDALAREAHAAFLISRRREKTHDAVTLSRRFEDLSRIEIEQNRMSVRSIPAKLAAIGCGVALDATTKAFAFSGDEVETLARLEHKRWVQTELSAANGDVERLSSKAALLLPWDDLDPDERDKDRAMVKAIPRILSSAGMSVVRLVPAPAATGRSDAQSRRRNAN